jgi:hypothetical protein
MRCLGLERASGDAREAFGSCLEAFWADGKASNDARKAFGRALKAFLPPFEASKDA